HVRIACRLQSLAEGRVVAGVSAFHENAAIIQPEVSIDDAKVAESKIGDCLVRALDAGGFDGHAQPVHIGVVNVPDPVMLDLDFMVDQGLVGRELYFDGVGEHTLAYGSPGNREPHTAVSGLARGVLRRGADPDQSSLP